MTESRVTCKRNHRLFEITPDGIAIKCRAGECRTVYVIAWAEIEAKREALRCAILLPTVQEVTR